MNASLRLAALTLAACAVSAVHAECLADGEVDELFANIQSRTPAITPEGLSDADAACTRAKLNALLLKKHGKAIGYKAGLTNAAVQKRFNAVAPVWGVLYEGMLLPGTAEKGAEVDAAFGARPLFEADMLVRVRSEAINRAKTPDDVLDAIDQVIPFIELPDLVVQAPPKLDGPAIAAINVGARLGVVGRPIPVGPTPSERSVMFDALRDMTVTMVDGAGTQLSRGKGSDILDHPLNAVVWLAAALAKEGLTMMPGDLISLGSFSPLLPPKAGLKVTATYGGLQNGEPVSVTFK